MPARKPTLTHLDGNTMQLVMRHLSAVDLLHLRRTDTSLRDAVDAAAPVWQALEKGCAEALSWRKLKRGHCDSRSWQKRLQRRLHPLAQPQCAGCSASTTTCVGILTYTLICRFCTKRKGLAEAMKVRAQLDDPIAHARPHAQ